MTGILTFLAGVGAAIGGVISWWVYNRQNKTSRTQDHILHHIEEIERKNGEILTHLESYAKHHDLVLNKILLIDENIQALNKKIESNSILCNIYMLK